MKTPRSPKDEFIDQMTRKKLVEWCDREINLPPPLLREDQDYAPKSRDEIYKAYAREKGWISKDGTKVLATGYQTAARFLKR